jgi:DNA-binding Lrp family transcriptional regulator
MISACILIRTEHGKYDQVAERMRQFKEVRQAFPVYGRYDVVVDVEADAFESLGDVILRMNRMAGVVFTETAVEITVRGN